MCPHSEQRRSKFFCAIAHLFEKSPCGSSNFENRILPIFHGGDMQSAIRLIWRNRPPFAKGLDLPPLDRRSRVLFECRFFAPLRFSIRLMTFQICRDPESWEWCLAEQLTGTDLYRGVERTKVSAQVAAQLAFENWLQVDRRGDGFSPQCYDWQAFSRVPKQDPKPSL